MGGNVLVSDEVSNRPSQDMDEESRIDRHSQLRPCIMSVDVILRGNAI